jgi:hypothetical protein
LRQLKSAPAKLKIAMRLRRETTLPIKSIAERMHLGSSKSANARLHAGMNGMKLLEPMQPLLGIGKK